MRLLLFLLSSLLLLSIAFADEEAPEERILKVKVRLDGNVAPPLPASFRLLLLEHFPDYTEENPLFAWEPPADGTRRFPLNGETRTYVIELRFFSDENGSAQAHAERLANTSPSTLRTTLRIDVISMKVSDPNKKDISYPITVLFTFIFLAVIMSMWLAYLRIDAPNTFFKYLPCCEGKKICCDVPTK